MKNMRQEFSERRREMANAVRSRAHQDFNSAAIRHHQGGIQRCKTTLEFVSGSVQKTLSSCRDSLGWFRGSAQQRRCSGGGVSFNALPFEKPCSSGAKRNRRA